MAEQAPGFDPDKGTRDAFEAVEKDMAQTTGEVPRPPFVTGPDGQLHELVEEDVRNAKPTHEHNEGEQQ